ncbi:hypothetical protein HNQ95_004606 [Aminobacter ciceronei]|uniref:Uncharacterized protein n=1 Tax=Aminobacter ciceronei TaxID=150723 RepID=A0ABR6CCG1_9HYPH|nr:hypothetical protein [Aminobacter ciceronei]MBA9022709.1 hypothetical protein [Aminobacter ciceronei]
MGDELACDCGVLYGDVFYALGHALQGQPGEHAIEDVAGCGLVRQWQASRDGTNPPVTAEDGIHAVACVEQGLAGTPGRGGGLGAGGL